MSARRLPHGSRLLALVALLATLVAAGCGGNEQKASSPSTGPDPASVAPADAAFYGQAVVRPTGAMKDGVLAAARKVSLIDDPAAALRRALDESSGEGDDVNFSRDVEPWLGQSAGGFLLLPPHGGSDPDGAVAFSIADRGAFDDALPRIRDEAHLRRAGTYQGIAYDKDDSGSEPSLYLAPVDDFYVAGTIAGLRAAIDASKGESLADASRFQDALDAVPDDALATFYVDPKAIGEALRSEPDAPPQVRQAFARLADADPFVGDLTATADEIAIEASGGGQQVTDALDGNSDAEVSVGQLPGDSWFALATPPLGPIIRNALVSAGVHDEAAAQLSQNVGLDLDRDLLELLGGLGVFVRGTNVLDIGGGALLQLTDAAAAQRLMTQIESIVRGGSGLPTRSLALSGARGFELQVPQSPQPIVVLQKGDRLAAGYATSSAQDLLDPQQRFDESSDGRAAIATLGDGFTPSFVLIVQPLAGLLRALDQLDVADLSSALPYVNAYRSLAIGTKRDGDRVTVRAVAALR
jgi:hypothetical protein